jgi:hypothetical protein
MALLAGLLACLTLWWLSKRSNGLGRRLKRAFGQGLGVALGRARLPTFGAFALLAAGFLLLRGNLVLAALLGLGGVWMIEGQASMTERLRRLVRPASGRGPGTPQDRRVRTVLIDALLNPDGSLRTGRVLAGPDIGAWLEAMPTGAVVDLLQLCRLRDAAGATLLEPYLDRRAPGWRVDAERDRDPRPGRPPNPGAMTQEEAYQVLGLQRGATTEEIRSAHRSLMKRAHPDQGGSAERAARVNAARDRLLSRHR